jgi:hypothetical protein
MQNKKTKIKPLNPIEWHKFAINLTQRAKDASLENSATYRLFEEQEKRLLKELKKLISKKK